MNPTNLTLDTLRTLVAAQDLGGRALAGARVGRTPSAVSLQMKKLQRDVGATLFRKKGRGTGLTETGELVLRYGRRILALNDELLDTVRGAALSGVVRVGVSQDFADSILPGALARFAAHHPLVVLEVRIEGNAAMADAVEKGELDLALAVGQAERAAATVIGEIDLVWIAGQSFQPRVDEPLPLALLGPQCAFRKEALAKLDASGRAWRIAALSPSLAGLWASAKGGLGVTARSSLDPVQGLISAPSLFGLPRLQPFAVTVHSRPETHPPSVREAVERLQALLADAVVESLAARRGVVAVEKTTKRRSPVVAQGGTPGVKRRGLPR